MDACPILAAMASHRRAWISAAELKLCGHDAGRLEALEADGLVARWTLPGGELWCLTPLAAERLQIVMDERWERQSDGTWLESPRWVEPERATDSVRLPGRHGAYRLAELAADLVPPEPPRPARRRGPVPAIDPVSGRPLVLFAGDGGSGILVWREHRALLKEIASPQIRARLKKSLDPSRPARRKPAMKGNRP
ncbi:MAG: hypothetical protein U0790_00065 [Isosphaeraceae bacterium]